MRSKTEIRDHLVSLQSSLQHAQANLRHMMSDGAAQYAGIEAEIASRESFIEHTKAWIAALDWVFSTP